MASPNVAAPIKQDLDGNRSHVAPGNPRLIASFEAAAHTVVCRALRLPAEVYAAVASFVIDARDWLQLWRTESDDQMELNCEPETTDRNHLSPRG